MDLNQTFGFLIILKQSMKLIFKNGKLMLSLTTLSLLLSSIFFLIFDFSSFSLMRDMLVKESLFPISSSNSSEFSNHFAKIKENFALLLTAYFSFVLSYLIVTLFSTIATVLVSSESYIGKNMSFKDFSLRIVNSCTRVLVTGFYTTVLVIGYVFLVISLATPLLMSSKMSILGLSILFGFGCYIIYMYLSSVWILSLVVAVIDEESCGHVALGKSVAIIKRQRINGFILNIFFSLVTLGVYLGSNWIKCDKFGILSKKMIIGLFVVNCSCLVRILTFVAYTVLYYKSKDGYSQEIELNGNSLEYTKLSFVNDLPA